MDRGKCNSTTIARQSTLATYMAQATLLYNESCDLIVNNGRSLEIIERLRTCVELLKGQVHTPQESELYARANVLLGQLREWHDPIGSMECYKTAVSCDERFSEGHLQLARYLWRVASSLDDLEAAEQHLRKAIDCQSEVPEEEDCDDLARKLLARLLLSTAEPGTSRYDEACNLLMAMGYEYTFSPAVLGSARIAHKSMPFPARKSARLQDAKVTSCDSVLPPCMLSYLQHIFSASSPFWSEHGYDSPSTGFFSYQIGLTPPFPAEVHAQTDRHDSAGTQGITPFHEVLHHLWRATCHKMPHVKRAKYAEWWAHRRPHSNGHLLHYDYISPSSPDGLPVHPLATSIVFVTSDCGGATLVTNETIANPRTQHGWLIHPAENRMATFRGSQLHCVLPGRGVCSQDHARRITLMVAFYDTCPRAPLFGAPPGTAGAGGGDRRKSPRHQTSGRTWLALFAEPIPPHESCCCAAHVPPSPQAQTQPKDDAEDHGATKKRRRFLESSTTRTGVTCSEPWLCGLSDASEGVEPVAQVYTALNSCRVSPTKRASISLLDDRMFAQFDALNSGLLLTENGVCSLNCGGTCDTCSQRGTR